LAFRASSRWHSLATFAAVLAACTIAGGCTTSPHSERAQFVAPSLVSEVYSRTNMQFLLAVTSSVKEKCGDAECLRNEVFDQRVQGIGTRLADAAYRAYPGLSERVAEFRFSVADKSEPGTASTAAGEIVVLRPVSLLAASDEALSFLIAREIGHVVARHHDENTGASLVVSALATVLMPVASVAKILATLFSSVTTAAASASVTAASFAGTQVVIESYRPRQREEADQIALKLLAQIGHDIRAVAAGFAHFDLSSPPTRWMADLRVSVGRLAAPVSPTAEHRIPSNALLAQAVSAIR
jgi:predicted Zn-dependent protease